MGLCRFIDEAKSCDVDFVLKSFVLFQVKTYLEAMATARLTLVPRQTKNICCY